MVLRCRLSSQALVVVVTSCLLLPHSLFSTESPTYHFSNFLVTSLVLTVMFRHQLHLLHVVPPQKTADYASDSLCKRPPGRRPSTSCFNQVAGHWTFRHWYTDVGSRWQIAPDRTLLTIVKFGDGWLCKQRLRTFCAILVPGYIC